MWFANELYQPIINHAKKIKRLIVYKRVKVKGSCCSRYTNYSDQVTDTLRPICDNAESLLLSEKPTKRQQKSFVETAKAILSLSSSREGKNPSLVADNCSRYSISRLHTASKYNTKTYQTESVPRGNMQIRIYLVCRYPITLPTNMVQYTAAKVCHILQKIE